MHSDAVSAEVLIHRLLLSGAVGLVTREIPEGWDIESTHFHRPNAVSYKLVTGIQRTTLIRAYLFPDIMDCLLDLEESLNCFLGRDPIVMGDLNADHS